MKNQHEKIAPEAESLREDFLDHFCAPLIGIVPQVERAIVRREIDAHLEALITEYEWSGQAPTEAIHSALQEMGEPWTAGEAWLAEWSVGQMGQQSAPSRPGRNTLLRPFAFFGCATMVNLLVIEQYALTPSGIVLLPLVVFLAAISPLLAGAFTGCTQTSLPLRSFLLVLLALSLHSFITGLLMLPRIEGICFAAFQIGGWFPLGAGAATVTNALVRSHSRRRFLQAIG